MITAIIIDDERNSVEMMEWLLKTYCPEVKVLALCTDGEEGIRAIREHRPDVVFLDIEMPKMNGFDLLEKFDDLFFDVIFVTAYNKFAIKAFRYSALSYLLKPVDPDELMEAVKRLEQKKQRPVKDQIQLLVEQMRNAESTPKRIALSTGDGLMFADTADIIYCKADSNYTEVILAGKKKMVVSKTLKEIDDALSGKDFFRVHHSYLINLNRISKYVRGEGGYLVMTDGTQISIARSKRDEFFEMFSKF